MKKFLFSLMMLGLLIGFVSCSSCSHPQEGAAKADTVQVDSMFELSMVEHIVATDRQEMFMQVSDDYRWFETSVEFEKFYDEEDTDSAILTVVNIFETIKEKGQGADVKVYAFTHLPDTTEVFVTSGLWIEDFPLEEAAIKLSWQEAYDRMMQADAPKPHSRKATLRKPIGPVLCNAQYVFGNIKEQLWVDAVTGDVKNSCPAFPDAFKMPLGEWP